MEEMHEDNAAHSIPCRDSQYFIPETSLETCIETRGKHVTACVEGTPRGCTTKICSVTAHSQMPLPDSCMPSMSNLLDIFHTYLAHTWRLAHPLPLPSIEEGVSS